ncbi:hypothetical protein Acsp04_39090 [Actinomadura sp. NBRC 104425]|uniref:helix-turn-helix domain-containing protein n=1 Tax=Actinomadura sp. NBRC 104425 TaxID=3032204 RepID=UPI0024A0C67E|nr:helix-turn-helix transcriptional regulator [Actinomadura sp. NBRC 104425]GLZ13674.1 hypothetical protein Acsp04_39090 [Actinomadura sp. NBRC 104425]
MEQVTPTAVISKRVRELRERRGGMSAQALADRCAELGMPSLKRQAIANLETGRRAMVTVEELLVLAHALDTSPVTLLMPDPGDELAVTPELSIDPRRLVLWLAGERPAEGLPTVRFERSVVRARWHRAAYDAEQRANQADRSARLARKDGEEQEADEYLQERDRHLQELAGILDAMLEAGSDVPAINAGYARMMIRRRWTRHPDGIRAVELPGDGEQG